jgi:hypothetical protein
VHGDRISGEEDEPTDAREWLIVEREATVLGTVSLIRPAESLPSFADFLIEPQSDPRIAEGWLNRRMLEVSALVGTPHAPPAFPVNDLLYRVLWQSHARRGDHDMWIMSMSIARLQKLVLRFPVPFEILSGIRDYYHNPSLVCVLDLRLARTALEMRAPATLAFLDGRPSAPATKSAALSVPDPREPAGETSARIGIGS